MKFHLYSLPLVLSMVTLQAFDYGPLKNQFIHDVIKIAPQLPGFNEGTGDAYNWLFQKIYQKKTVNLPVVPLIATLVSHTSPTKEVLIHAAASKNQTSVASTISRLKPFLKELHLNKKTYAQLLKSPFPLLRKNAKAIPFTELETAGEPFADDQLVDMLLALTQTIDEMKVPLEKSIKILCILEELLSHKDTPSSLQKVLSQVLEKDQTITGIELVYVAEMLLLPPNFMLQLAAPASKVIAQNFSEKINGDSLEEEIYNVIRFFGGNQEPAARIILAHPLLLRKKQDFEIPRLNKAIFDTEGKHLITTSSNLLQIWSAKNGCLLKTFDTQANKIKDIGTSSDGKILTALSDGTAKVWDPSAEINDAPVLTLPGHIDSVDLATFSWDEKEIITICKNTVTIWNAKVGSQVRTFQIDANTIETALSPDKKKLLSKNAKTITIWDLTSGQQESTLETSQFCFSAIFSADGTKILTVLESNLGVLWDTKTGDFLQTFLEKTSYANRAATFSPDNKEIAIDLLDGVKTLVWNTQTGNQLFSILGRNITFTQENIISSSKKLLLLWDTQKNGVFIGSTVNKHPIDFLKMSPDGNYLLTTSLDHGLTLWKLCRSTKVSMAEYIIYQAYLQSGLASFQSDYGTYGKKIIEKFNKRLPKDQPLIPAPTLTLSSSLSSIIK